MHFSSVLLALTSLAVTATAQSTTCKSYVLVDIRGTGEPQGPSVGFLGMVNQTLAAVPNGIEYDVVYPAETNQTYQIGSADAVRFINAGLSSCPNQKYAILGYSQGASATMGALMKYTDMTSAAYKAIAAVLVIGNPYHVPNKTNDIDQMGTDLTRKYSGVVYDANSPASAGIPELYYSSGKLLDICFTADIICAPRYPNASITGHLGYINNKQVQDRGAQFLISKLTSNGSSTRNGTATTSSGPATTTGAASGGLRAGNAVFAVTVMGLVFSMVL